MPRIIDLTKVSPEEAVAEAVAVLKAGGIFIYPTETVYGIGADAINQSAVDKVLSYKARREGKPMSVAVTGMEMASEYVEVNETAKNLYQNFLPGPLTVVSKSKHKVAKGVESELGTLGIRVPNYPLILEIIKSFGKPFTSTSANASYQKRPYTIEDVFDSISEKQTNLIDLVLNAGRLPKRDPSTVVDTTLNQEVVLRQGDLKMSEVLSRETNSPEETQQLGSELLKKYYQHLGYKSVIFALQGELGAGKTEMTKGIARALGVKEIISSPTFIIEKEYDISTKEDSFLARKMPKLYHIDTWRLFESSELEALGFMNQVSEGNVFVVEWADKVTDLLQSVADDAVIIWVKLSYADEITKRSITVSDFIS